jgi:hypothetical protein
MASSPAAIPPQPARGKDHPFSYFSRKKSPLFKSEGELSGFPADIEPGDAQRQRIMLNIREPGLVHHAGKALRGGELEDGIGKIQIGRGVAGKPVGEPWQDPVEIKGAQKPQDLLLRRLHFQNGHLTAIYQDAGKFPQRPQTVGDIADAEGDPHHVERLVRKGKGQGVRLDEGDPIPAFLPAGAFYSRLLQHFQDKIYTGHLNVRITVRHFQGQIRRAGGHVEVAAGLGETHLPGGKTTPGHIPAETEQVIEKIVLPRNRRKNILDHPNVFIGLQVFDRGVIPLQVFFHGEQSFVESMTLSSATVGDTIIGTVGAPLPGDPLSSPAEFLYHSSYRITTRCSFRNDQPDWGGAMKVHLCAGSGEGV